MHKAMVFAGLVLVFLTGCEIQGPSAKVEGPKVKVDESIVSVESGNKGSQGDFCPPGQAKKGRC